MTKDARTVTRTDAIPGELRTLTATAATPHRGPVFLDIPLDVMHRRAGATLRPPLAAGPPAPDPDEIAKAAELLAAARRPVLVAGGDVWWGGAWEALRRCAESLRVPTFANGQGRGCLPARHELAFSRCRDALKEADVVVVAGTPWTSGSPSAGSATRASCTPWTTPRCAPRTCPRPPPRPETCGASSTAWRPGPAPGGPRGVDAAAAGPGTGPARGRTARAGARGRAHPPRPGPR
ncbi:hypothetical protein ACFQ3Z_07235 [Streptomyces nogalater]